MNDIRQRLLAWWQELTLREQAIVGVAFVVLVFGVIVGGLYPLYSAHDKADERVKRRAERLFDMQVLERKAMQRPQQTKARSGKGLGSISPIAFIESAADNAGVKDKIKNIRPGPTERINNAKFTTISFQIADLTMQEITDVLFEIEYAHDFKVDVTRFKTDRKERKTSRVEVQMELRILL